MNKIPFDERIKKIEELFIGNRDCKISVMYGKFIIGYSKQEGYELLYASKNVKDLYSWTYDD
ncbi:MAG: hypothetical protein K2N90_09690, partial [Lachnospiraceae bacterium]|nr:hypothetical protein [Lachnospiraceae bacterium]